jgi:hypothetical protein
MFIPQPVSQPVNAAPPEKSPNRHFNLIGMVRLAARQNSGANPKPNIYSLRFDFSVYKFVDMLILSARGGWNQYEILSHNRYNSKNDPLYLLCFAVGNKKGAPIAIKIAQDILKN